MTFEAQFYETDGLWNPDVASFDDDDFRRVARMAQLVSPSARTLIDVGCGNGIFCNYLAAQRPDLDIIGVDRSATALRYVKVPHQQASIDALPFPDEAFDVVTSFEVLEHLPVPVYNAALRELTRVAKHAIIVSVPWNQQLGRRQTSCLACRTSFDPFLHVRSFDAAAVQGLLHGFGWRCCHSERFGVERWYWGVDHYAAFIRRGQPPIMRAPVCPVCGWRNTGFRQGEAILPPKSRGHRMAGRVTALPKRALRAVWPVVTQPRWICGVYGPE